MAINPQSPGVYSQERAQGTGQIIGVPTSISGFIMRTLRGPVNKRVRTTSAAQAKRIFGGYSANSYFSEAVDAFFGNGGAVLDIVRVQGSSSGSNVKSSYQAVTDGPAGYGELLSSANAFPAPLVAGDTFIGAVDGGSSGTATVAATPATITFTGGTYAAGAAGDSITVSRTVMGNTVSSTKDLSAVGNTQADWIAALNTITGMSAAASSSDIVFSTDQKGSGAAATITAYGGAARTKLGGPVAGTALTNAGPNNIAIEYLVTAAELAAMFEAVANLGTGATASAVTATQFSWKTNTAGASPKGVQLTGGTGVSKISGFDTNFHAGAAATSQNSMLIEAVGPGPDGDLNTVVFSNQDIRVGSIASLVSTGSVDSIELTAGTATRVAAGDTLYFSDATTGGSARGIVSQVKNRTVYFTASVTVSGGNLTAANTLVTNETFSFTILREGRVAQGPYNNLRVSPLSLANYFVTKINRNNDEDLVQVTDSGAAIGAGLDIRPVNEISGGDSLQDGEEATVFADLDYIGANTTPPTGFYVFDNADDIRLLATPGITGTTAGAISKALADYCTARADCVAILDVPLNTSVTNTITYRSDTVGGSSYGITYYPWIQILDPVTSLPAYVPPSPFAMGCFARTDGQKGVQKVAAGNTDGRLSGTIGVERELSQAERDLLYPANVNPIINIPGVGQCLFGSRTMETGEYNQINARRVAIYVRKSIQQGTSFVLFEPNDAPTRAKARRAAEAFLRAEWRKDPPLLDGEREQDAFFVTCDESNNPPTTINSGRFEIDVGIKIPRTAEFVIVTCGQKQEEVP